MESTLTFLNVHDAPGLGPSQTKAMRAHVTRANFAQRRRRIAHESRRWRDNQGQTSSPEVSTHIHHTSKECGGQDIHDVTALKLRRTPSSPTDIEYCVGFLLNEYRPALFLYGSGAPGSHGEATFIRYTMSEPALLEASMAVAAQQSMSLDPATKFWRMKYHGSRAIRSIIQQIASPESHIGDGLLGAVYTLAFGETLVSNWTARRIHVQGLARMIELRHQSGNNTVPHWFTDLLLYERLPHIIRSPKTRCDSFAGPLLGKNTYTTLGMGALSKDLDWLRSLIQSFQEQRAYGNDLTQHIDEHCRKINERADDLLQDSNPYVRAFSRAIRLFVWLSWPRSSSDEEAGHVLEELHNTLLQPKVRLCTSVELTLWQMFVGCVAAEGHPEMREWFMYRMKALFACRKFWTWESIFQFLSKAFLPDSRLLLRFKAVCDEALAANATV